MDILHTILAAKQREVAAARAATPLAAIKQQAKNSAPARPFAAALQSANTLPLIAEIKKRSPSKGILCDPFNPQQIAADYAAANAACLSVLTDSEFFGGSADDLQTARTAAGLPVLRKDFMIDEWQIYQSRAMGADAILLIVAALDDDTLLQLAAAALALGMAVLVEVHSSEEMTRALRLPAAVLLGINNRNLRTFTTSLQTTLDIITPLRDKHADRTIISESGIHQPTDIATLQQAGVNGFLIGEALLANPRHTIARLFA